MKIAFAGNPNSGKTTMFNALTGNNEKVGNWAGVTVDIKEAPIKKQYAGNRCMVAADLPGAYSMSPFTSEEGITRDYILGAEPDVIINIVDATNLSRSLFFTTQLLELGIPVVIALNKADITEKKRTQIDEKRLSRELGCPVVETVSIHADGLRELVSAAAGLVGKQQVAPYRPRLEEGEAADRERFAFVDQLVAKIEKRQVFTRDRNRQDKVDNLLTHPLWGLVTFGVVMFFLFQISQAWVGPRLAEWLVGYIDSGKEWLAKGLDNAGANAFLAALLTEGVVGGVSAVIGFLPLVMVLYFMISLLEDCGYMARATVVLDPLFQKVGLSGKSVIPFIVGTGCAVPGVMAVRAIRTERERNVTAMLTPFMPCGAKLPVIALFAGAFFSDAPWVGTLMYFVGILLILLCALLVNRIVGHKAKNAYFIIELPEYKCPSLKRGVRDMASRGWEYIVKAGTVLLLCNAAIFIMQSFDWQLSLVGEGDAASSILASVARPVAVALVPVIGVAAWQMAAAAVSGFIAKENVVGTLAVCYGISNLFDSEAQMLEGAGTEVAAAFGLTKAAALAFLMFNLFTPPCFAAIGAMNAEITKKKWLWGGIALQLGVGYTLGFFTYQIGTLLTEGTVGHGFVPGLAVVAVMTAIVTWLCIRAGKNATEESCCEGRK